MPIVKTCSSSEEACLATGALESAGIEANIIDHSSFDSSLLGVTAGVDTLAIEVSEDDVERAVEVLAPAPAASKAEPEVREHAGDSGTVDPRRLREVFRTLVVVEVVVIAFSIVVSDALYHDTPTDFDSYIISQIPSVGLWEVADRVANGFILMCLLASVLIFQFMRLGRILYLANTAWWLITYVAYPPALRTPVGEFINLLEWALAGALITMMWLPPLSARFQRKPSAS